MRPFEGIRVIDATHVLAGPFAAYQLGVLGADVIKIEPPEGEASRGWPPTAASNTSGVPTARSSCAATASSWARWRLRCWRR